MAVGTTSFPTSLDTVVELVEITNNASSTLSGNVLIGDTTIGVVDIGEFPTTGYGTIVDDLTSPSKVEIISWTGKSGSNLTGCTRGTQGTSAAAFSSGNYIEVRPTAGHHEALRGAVIAIETKLGTGSTIAVNKLAALTASKAVVTDASGFLASATVTAAELGYLSGVTTPTGSGALVLATSPTLTTPTIAKLSNLTSNGFVKTSGGDGTLSVDTSTYLTANQTITLSGDVTGSGTAAITATIANDAVTYAKLQDISATQRVLGRNTAAAGNTEEVTITQLLDWAGTAAQGDILYRGASAWALLAAGTNGHYLKTQGAGANPTWAAVAGGGLGDVVGPGSATDNAVVRFDSTTGKLVQDSVVTIADTTGNMAGVGTLNGHTIPAGTDTFVLLTANQTLTTKTLTSPDINGGTADSLTSLSVRSTGAAFDLLFANTEVLTGNKTLTFKVNDAARTVDLGGNLTLAAAFSTSGANALTLTTTGATNVTLPTTGTLAIVGGTLAQFAATTSSQLAGVISDETGSGSLVFGTAPTFASTIAIGTAGGTTGAINLNGTTSGTVTLKVADVAGTYLLTLPTNDGDAGQFLQTDGAGVTSWAAGGGGLTIGTTAITSGTAGRVLYETAGNVVGEIAGSAVTAEGAVTIAPSVRSSGVASYFAITTPADTGITADTESIGIRFGGNSSAATVTRTLADGTTLATQREYVFVAPTYAAAGATTITTAATVAITGAPAAGTNATITNAFSLHAPSGKVYLGWAGTPDYTNIFGSGTITHYFATDTGAYAGVWALSNLVPSFFSTWGGVRYRAGIGVTPTRIVMGASSNHPVEISQNDTAAIYIDTSQLVGIGKGTGAASAQLHILSGSASRVALRVDSAASPSVDIVQFTNNSTNYWQLGSAGAVTMTSQTANTSSVATANTINVNSTGTTAAGFGGQILYQLESTTTDSQSAAALGWLWTTATHASRTSAITFSTVDNAASLAERWRLTTNGAGTGVSTTTTGFFGGTNVTGMLAESITLNTGGTTTDSTIDLPANSIILSVTGRITTTITTATDWKLGDATIADRFSDANATLTAGTTTVGINQWKADRTTAGQGAFQQSTAKVRITTTGTPGAGVIRITIHYITLSAPTS